MLPTAVNALLRPLAKLLIPAVAANATSARINKYSTRPWPDSSFCRRISEFRRNIIIVFLLCARMRREDAYAEPEHRCVRHVRGQSASAPTLTLTPSDRFRFQRVTVSDGPDERQRHRRRGLTTTGVLCRVITGEYADRIQMFTLAIGLLKAPSGLLGKEFVHGCRVDGSLNHQTMAGNGSIGIAVRLAAIALLTYVLASHAAFLKANVSKRDSISYWAAAHLLVHHQNPYEIDAVISIERQQGYTESRPLVLRTPPWSLVMVLPLAAMNPFWGWAFWVGISIGALAVSARLCWRMFGDGGRSPAWFWVVAYTFAPVPACLVSGQMGLLLLLGVVIFLYFEPINDFIAGAALILPFAKPHLLSLFWLVLAIWIVSSRRWRVAAGFASAVGLAIFIAVLFDPSVFPDYNQMLRQAAIGNEFIPALSGVLRLLFFHRLFWVQFIPLALAIVWAIVFYRQNRTNWNWREHGLFLMTLSVLVTPYAWLTDEVVLLPAVLQAGVWIYTARRGLTLTARLAVVGFASLNVLLLLILRAKVPFATGIYFWSSAVWLSWYLFGRSFRRGTERKLIPAVSAD